MLGLPLRVRTGLAALALIGLSSISAGSASAQPAPQAPPASAQPAPLPALPPSGAPAQPAPPPAQPAPPAGPGFAPPPAQTWYPPQNGYPAWQYYPPYGYGYGYDSPYIAPPPPPKEPYNRKYMTAGIVMTVGGIVGLLVGSVVVAMSKDQIDVYCDGPVLCAHLDDPIRKGVGVGMMIGGGAVAFVGIPLWIVGGRKVPVRKKVPDTKDAAPPVPAPAPAALEAPVLRVGATGASLSIPF